MGKMTQNISKYYVSRLDLWTFFQVKSFYLILIHPVIHQIPTFISMVWNHLGYLCGNFQIPKLFMGDISVIWYCEYSFSRSFSIISFKFQEINKWEFINEKMGALQNTKIAQIPIMPIYANNIVYLWKTLFSILISSILFSLLHEVVGINMIFWR